MKCASSSSRTVADPVYRRTPISFLHKVVWKYIPNGIAYCDDRLLGGWLLRRLKRAAGYVFHENHPLVLVSFQRKTE